MPPFLRTIIKEATSALIAAVLLAATAGIAAVAAGFAIYAGIKPNLGPAAAAGLTALAFAALLAALVFSLPGMIRGAKTRAHNRPQNGVRSVDPATGKMLMEAGAATLAIVADFIFSHRQKRREKKREQRRRR